ncbi:hypothetical protein RRG08_048383 [Elysia crispata]|uniref:Uncharacterized protein n=1 Tax=Elysia crispata TaxID=231223 RepID=A0AAE1EBV5_9GAST|nr:hypothetical protein RRG08_048383 [Elysia crispata]
MTQKLACCEGICSRFDHLCTCMYRARLSEMVGLGALVMKASKNKLINARLEVNQLHTLVVAVKDLEEPLVVTAPLCSCDLGHVGARGILAHIQRLLSPILSPRKTLSTEIEVREEEVVEPDCFLGGTYLTTSHSRAVRDVKGEAEGKPRELVVSISEDQTCQRL